MAIELVKEYFKKFGIEDKILVFEESGATVELASMVLDVEPKRIAKTLSFRSGEGCMLVVMAGDARVDNKKYREYFSMKAKMLTAEEVVELVGHAVGGVCPFGIKPNIPVYLDISLKRFNTVFPACGSSNSAIELTLEELFKYSNSLGWVDICKDWQSEDWQSNDDVDSEDS